MLSKSRFSSLLYKRLNFRCTDLRKHSDTRGVARCECLLTPTVFSNLSRKLRELLDCRGNNTEKFQSFYTSTLSPEYTSPKGF